MYLNKNIFAWKDKIQSKTKSTYFITYNFLKNYIKSIIHYEEWGIVNLEVLSRIYWFKKKKNLFIFNYTLIISFIINNKKKTFKHYVLVSIKLNVPIRML